MTSLRHLRSDTANKRPDPAALSTGQVAINYESGSPGLFFKDSAGNLVKAGPVHIGTSAPNATPAAGGSTGNAVGEFWLDTTGGANDLKIWSGSAWVSTSGEYVNVTGDTMTGDLTLDNANIVFEGSTADTFETTLTVADPTADNTITLPNVSGTVVTTGDTGSVTSTMIADATIVNADISASAEIAVSKLADGTARQLLQTDAAGTGVEWTSNVDVPGTLDVTGAAVFDSTVSIAGDTTIADKIIHSGDTNTAIRFPAADTVSVETAGSERARIDSSGRLLVGTSSSRSVDAQMVVQIEGTTQQTSSMSLTRNTNDGAPPNIVFGKSRGTTTGSSTIVQNGDTLGVITFLGADGTDINSKAASIEAQVDGTPGANDMPGRLVFSTTADGASSPTERMKITQDGSVVHHGNVAYFTSPQTGSTFGVLSVYTGGTSLISFGTLKFTVRGDGDVENVNNSYGAISDAKLKENIVDANSQWDDLKSLQVRNYNFKSDTGYGTHTQIGLVAQEVELVSPGLVSASPDRDEEGNDLGTVTKSVNYSVLYMKAVKALQEAMERIESLEAKVAALESA